MSLNFDRVAIIGVGLLGSSLGLAMKARGLARHVVGVGHRQSSLDTALQVGAVDEATLSLSDAVTGADLIIIATPAGLVAPKLDEIRLLCAPDTIVTDVASTKRTICAHAHATWTAPRRFIGSHPMAGSDKYGPEHGHPDFYEGAVCLVEDSEGLEHRAREIVCALWAAVGARVLDVDPAQHDTMLARTSHIPHVVSAALASLAVRGGDVRFMIGNAFRDMTRIAASRPELWRDICLTNREAVLEGLREFQRDLEELTRELEAGNAPALDDFFRQGAEARRKAVES